MSTSHLPQVRNAGAILARADGYAYGYGGPGLPPRGHKKKKRRHIHHAPKKSGGGVRSDINVTPLVDVVLVLLIIFMVVTPMLHRGVDVELPRTRNHSTRQDTGEQLVVTVRQDGVYIEADKIDIDKLEATVEKEMKNNPSRPVNVHGERSMKFGEVRKVLEHVHNGGAMQVNMETKEQEK